MMRELNGLQLKQISGGVSLTTADAFTHHLTLSPSDFFFFSNIDTGDIYLFMGDGSVLYLNPLNKTSYPVSFPFKIVNDGLCEFTVPSSMLKLSC